MQKYILEKPIGNIEIEYHVDRENCVINSAVINEVDILSTVVKAQYCTHNGNTYMGFKLEGEDYKSLCSATGKVSTSDNCFISFDKNLEKAIKNKIEENNLTKRFIKEIQEARFTGKNIVVKSDLIPCNDDDEDCSWDYIMYTIFPSGKVESKRIHTY